MSIWSPRLHAPRDPGIYELELDVLWCFVPLDAVVKFHRDGPLPDLAVATELSTYRHTLTVVPDGTPVRQALVDPDQRAALHAGIQVLLARVQPIAEGGAADPGVQLVVQLNVRIPDGMTVIFDVIAEVGDQSCVGNRFAVRREVGGAMMIGSPDLTSPLEALDQSIEELTIILRPALDDRTASAIPFGVIWGEDVVLRGVPLERLDLSP